jgi:hypothetical protein
LPTIHLQRFLSLPGSFRKPHIPVQKIWFRERFVEFGLLLRRLKEKIRLPRVKVYSLFDFIGYLVCPFLKPVGRLSLIKIYIMLEFFRNLGFVNIIPFTGGFSFTAYYTENGFDLDLYYDKERGFIKMGVEKHQLKKELLPSIAVHDPKELQSIILKLLHFEMYFPKLYERIKKYPLPENR